MSTSNMIYSKSWEEPPSGVKRREEWALKRIFAVSDKGVANLDSDAISKLDGLCDRRIDGERESIMDLELLVDGLDIQTTGI